MTCLQRPKKLGGQKKLWYITNKRCSKLEKALLGMSKKQKPVKAPGNFQKLVKAEAMKKRACKGFIAAELDSFRFW
jgi:hypothetical protein